MISPNKQYTITKSRLVCYYILQHKGRETEFFINPYKKTCRKMSWFQDTIAYIDGCFVMIIHDKPVVVYAQQAYHEFNHRDLVFTPNYKYCSIFKSNMYYNIKISIKLKLYKFVPISLNGGIFLGWTSMNKLLKCNNDTMYDVNVKTNTCSVSVYGPQVRRIYINSNVVDYKYQITRHGTVNILFKDKVITIINGSNVKFDTNTIIVNKSKYTRYGKLISGSTKCSICLDDDPDLNTHHCRKCGICVCYECQIRYIKSNTNINITCVSPSCNEEFNEWEWENMFLYYPDPNKTSSVRSLFVKIVGENVINKIMAEAIDINIDFSKQTRIIQTVLRINKFINLHSCESVINPNAHVNEQIPISNYIINQILPLSDIIKSCDDNDKCYLNTLNTIKNHLKEHLKEHSILHSMLESAFYTSSYNIVSIFNRRKYRKMCNNKFIAKNNIILCGNCNSYIQANDNDDPVVCDNCHHARCKKCDIYKLVDHKCDPNDVYSYNMIVQNSQKCPRCKTRIMKLPQTCDQMFCVHCNTKFNYRSGLIISDSIPYHNDLHTKWEQSNNIANHRVIIDMFIRTSNTYMMKKHNEYMWHLTCFKLTLLCFGRIGVRKYMKSIIRLYVNYKRLNIMISTTTDGINNGTIKNNVDIYRNMSKYGYDYSYSDMSYDQLIGLDHSVWFK